MDLLAFTHLSDFQIILPEKTYKLHKVILNRCEYFSSLFRSTNKENINSRANFDYPITIFDTFIACLYGGVTDTDWNPVLTEELLDLAIYFQYGQLIDECINLITRSSNNTVFVSTIIKYPHLVGGIDKDKFRKCCTDRVDDIISLAEHIPDINLLILILRMLEDASIDKIFSIITSWIGRHNEINLKSDIIDKIIDVSYSANRNVVSSINNPEYNQYFHLLLGKVMTDSIYYASSYTENIIANIGIGIGISKYEIIHSNGKFYPPMGNNFAIEIKSNHIDNFDLVFNIDGNGILKLKVNQDVSLFCAFTSISSIIVCKRLSLSNPITLNTCLFDNKTANYRLSLLIL